MSMFRFCTFALCVAALWGCQAKSTRPPDPAAPGAAPGKVASSQPVTTPPSAEPAAPSSDGDDKLPLSRISLPPGFRISIYADEVKDARSLALSPSGTLFVGTRTDNRVYAIPNRDGDAHGDAVLTIAEGLHSPNGVALHEGALYVAEQNRILRFDDIENKLDKKPRYQVLNKSLPDEDHHGWKFLAVGPDKKLYLSIGAPCNVCDEKDPRFASISRMDLSGKGFEIFARGIRNSVGFDFHPASKELWFTENGRDRLGNDTPPDELNRAPTAGLHFGFPYCHAGTIQDPDFGDKGSCADSEKPVRTLGPHVAALGMRFYQGSQFPARYRNQIFIAEHGSWNRDEKIGYRIMLVTLEGNEAKSYEVFAQGWLHEGEVWGRPVDLVFMHDGSMLVSDDEAHAIYRISYQG
jgi:glucose/arabinose dehydrogenase